MWTWDRLAPGILTRQSYWIMSLLSRWNGKALLQFLEGVRNKIQTDAILPFFLKYFFVCKSRELLISNLMTCAMEESWLFVTINVSRLFNCSSPQRKVFWDDKFSGSSSVSIKNVEYSKLFCSNPEKDD